MHLSKSRSLSTLARTLLLGLGLAAGAVAAQQRADGAPESQYAESQYAVATGVDVPASEVQLWRELGRQAGKQNLLGFPLSAEESVDLALTRFFVTGPQTSFVLGSGQQPIDFDPRSVTLLRGSVRGYPNSRAFLALSDYGSLGYVDLGEPGRRYSVSSSAPGSSATPQGARVGLSASAGGWSLPVGLCGLDADGASVPPPPLSGFAGASGSKHIELAVETDYEFYQLFGNLPAASAYVVSLYGVVSDIFLRDVNAWIELSYVRLWDDPNDLFNEPSPLQPFREYWEANMGAVQRDLAQFFSGRRDLPWGGIAWVGGLCNDYGYSACGYALGFFADPSGPAIGNRDITVSAHELGHNMAAYHTHNYGLDTCDDEYSMPRRGTIMSYCGQVFTGGEKNSDPRFHTVVQDVIEDYLAQSTCVDDDCNQNAIADALDIAQGTSLDVNGNGIPDECEDCNGNGTLDPEDISTGASVDLNANGVPDECEPDCNGNAVPDELDIAMQVSLDQNFNRVPDECEPDCDGDGTLDYVQINADMSLDLNRNRVLDSCEDCDGDGAIDLVELDHAHNVWIGSLDHSTLREYLAKVGTLTDISDPASIDEAQDLIITPDRRMLVSSLLDHRVLEFSVDGSLVGDLVTAGSGGLMNPAGLLLRPNGNLLVASRGTHAVLEFDGSSGAPLGAFVDPGAGGLTQPFGLAFGPESDLYVTSNDGRVLRYDGLDGSFEGEFVSVPGNGGLDDPHGLLFLPNGNLLVASYETNQILEYELGSGSFLRQFNQGGTVDRLTLDQPWCMRLGPNGNVFVSRAHDHPMPGFLGGSQELHLTNARIYEFHVELGFLIRAYILGVDSGIEHPTGFDFVPGMSLDCNANGLPDECDLAAGIGQDANANGTLDECDINTYCRAKRNSAGCPPRIGFNGLPRLTGPDEFHITASGVLGATPGYLALGLAPNPTTGAGPLLPFGPSLLSGRNCVLYPMIAGVQTSSGSAGTCYGSFDFHVPQTLLSAQGLQAGTSMYAQVWYDDPNHSDGSGIGHTDALEWILLP